MGKLSIQVLVMAMIAAMACGVTATAQANVSVPPRIVPAGATSHGHRVSAAVKKHHHRKAVRHQRKRR